MYCSLGAPFSCDCLRRQHFRCTSCKLLMAWQQPLCIAMAHQSAPQALLLQGGLQRPSELRIAVLAGRGQRAPPPAGQVLLHHGSFQGHPQPFHLRRQPQLVEPPPATPGLLSHWSVRKGQLQLRTCTGVPTVTLHALQEVFFTPLPVEIFNLPARISHLQEVGLTKSIVKCTILAPLTSSDAAIADRSCSCASEPALCVSVSDRCSAACRVRSSCAPCL